MTGLTTDQSGNQVVLGSGSYVYEVVPDWGQLPSGVKFGYTHGVQVDSQNRIIVHNQSKDSVIFFDADGDYVKSWGPEFQKGAHGCLLRKEAGTEYLYLSDHDRHIVVKTTLDGDTIWTLAWPQECGFYKSEAEFKPTNVAVSPNGDIYVADGYGLSYVHQYSSKLEWIRSWGGKGSGPGQLDCPHGIWVDLRPSTPIVMVADRGNARLQSFTLDGQHIAFFTDGMRMPCHFDQNPKNGDLLIPDLHAVVTICGGDNKPVVQLGDNYGVWDKPGWPNFPRQTWQPGKFSTPHAACWDLEENIYVVEWIAEGRVTKLKKI